MDTFMDKLAQKFTAQEMIKANTTAEMEELDRLRTQVQEYSACLNRMQDICTQVEQTADAARNKMDSAQVNTDELRQQLIQMQQAMQNSAQDASQLEGMRSMLEEQLNGMRQVQDAKFESMQGVLENQLYDLKGTQGDQLASIRGMQDAQLDSIRGIQDAQLDSIRGMQNEQLASIRGLQNAQLDSIKGMQDVQFENMRSSMEDQLDSMRSMVKAQVSGIKNLQDMQFDNLRGALEAQNGTLETQLDGMKNTLETQLSNSNEYVHKECVKVYRNVQAVVGEENSKQTDNVEGMLNPLKAKLKNIYGISIAALVISLAGVALQVLSLLKIF